MSKPEVVRGRVSFIIPVYDRKQFIRDAIQSCLAQDYDDIEIVIMHDASTADIRLVISEYLSHPNLSFYKNEANLGFVWNVRRAVEEIITGEYFLVLGDDDYLVSRTFLSSMMDIKKSFENVTIMSGKPYCVFEDYSKEYIDLPVPSIPRYAVFSGIDYFLDASVNAVIASQFGGISSTFYHTQTIKGLDCFSDPKNLTVDFELLIKALFRGKILVFNEYICACRYHSQQLHNEYGASHMFVLFKSLMRSWDFIGKLGLPAASLATIRHRLFSNFFGIMVRHLFFYDKSYKQSFAEIRHQLSSELVDEFNQVMATLTVIDHVKAGMSRNSPLFVKCFKFYKECKWRLSVYLYYFFNRSLRTVLPVK